MRTLLCVVDVVVGVVNIVHRVPADVDGAFRDADVDTGGVVNGVVGVKFSICMVQQDISQVSWMTLNMCGSGSTGRHPLGTGLKIHLA